MLEVVILSGNAASTVYSGRDVNTLSEQIVRTAPGGVKATSVPVCRQGGMLARWAELAQGAYVSMKSTLGAALDVFLGDGVFDDDVEPKLDWFFTLGPVFALTDRGARDADVADLDGEEQARVS